MSLARRNIGIALNKAKPIQISQLLRLMGLRPDEAQGFGEYRAKVMPSLLKRLEKKPDGKLVLITSLGLIESGDGKTCTTIGITQSLAALKKKAVACIPQHTVGAYLNFNQSGLGSGNSCILPRNEISTTAFSDYGAIETSNNLISAAIDNHISNGNKLDFSEILWHRCTSINDASLRKTRLWNEASRKVSRSEEYISTQDSEIASILSLFNDLSDLKNRISKVTIGTSGAGKPILLSDLKIQDSIFQILKEAALPNLLQTFEGLPCFMHGVQSSWHSIGSPSFVAIKSALKIAHYAVAEIAPMSQLGLHKFMETVVKTHNLIPSAAVVVIPFRSDHETQNYDALYSLINRSIRSFTGFGLTPVFALNIEAGCSENSIKKVSDYLADKGLDYSRFDATRSSTSEYSDLAQKIVNCALYSEKPRFSLEKDSDIESKIRNDASNLFNTKQILISEELRRVLSALNPEQIRRISVIFSSGSNPSDSSRSVKLSAKHVLSGARVLNLDAEKTSLTGMPENPHFENIRVNKSYKIDDSGAFNAS